LFHLVGNVPRRIARKNSQEHAQLISRELMYPFAVNSRLDDRHCFPLARANVKTRSSRPRQERNYLGGRYNYRASRNCTVMQDRRCCSRDSLRVAQLAARLRGRYFEKEIQARISFSISLPGQGPFISRRLSRGLCFMFFPSFLWRAESLCFIVTPAGRHSRQGGQF